MGDQEITGAWIEVLDEALMAAGVGILAASDDHLGGVVKRYGPPPMWAREPGFSTLLLLILEQQVSLASARAAYDHLVETVGELTPDSFLRLDDAELLRVGFSRQKARYGKLLAGAVLGGSLDLDSLGRLSDEDVLAGLTSLTGIGPWTANTYLLMALRRPDVWPVGDIALHAAYQDLAGLAERPSTQEMVAIAEAWKPWRAVAARILWYHYLGGVE